MLSAVVLPHGSKGPWSPALPRPVLAFTAHSCSGSSGLIDVQAALLLATSAARPYLNDLKPTFDFVSPKSLTMNAVKSAIYTSLPLVLAFNQYVQQAQEAEEQGVVVPDFDFKPHLQDFPEKFAVNFGRNLTISAMRSGFERLALLYLPVRITDKLTKDFGRSAVRKYVKFGRLGAAVRIGRTTVFAQLLPYLAMLLADIGTVLYEHYVQKKKGKKTAWQEIQHKLTQYVCMLAASAAGAAVGTLIYPGVMTTLCAVLGEAAVLLIV